MKRNILIVGQGANCSALAKKLYKLADAGKIYIAPSNGFECEYYENVDIRENDLTGLLKFALENDIHLTIPFSRSALEQDIVSFFQLNGQNIFGPLKGACNIALSKTSGRKFLYKLHAQCAKFGVFNKLQLAKSYLEESNFPVIIQTEPQSNTGEFKTIATTMKIADDFLEKVFSIAETEVLIEDFTYGKNFTVYFITDGYIALPATVVANIKINKNGKITDGISCFAPDFNVSQLVISRIQHIVDNILSALDRKGCAYTGFLGLECILTSEDRFYVNEIKPFLQNHDAGVVLSLIEDDLLEIFNACINGFFADEYEEIKTNDYCSAASVLFSDSIGGKINIERLGDMDNVDFINISCKDGEYTISSNEVLTLSCKASTISRAKTLVEEELKEIQKN